MPGAPDQGCRGSHRRQISGAFDTATPVLDGLGAHFEGGGTQAIAYFSSQGHFIYTFGLPEAPVLMVATAIYEADS
jgi:hypothetical protein